MKSSVLSSPWCTSRRMWWRLLLILPLLHALQCHFFSASCIGTYAEGFLFYAGGDFLNLAVLNRAGTGFWTLAVFTVCLSSGRTSWALFVFFSVSASTWTPFSGFLSSSSVCLALGPLLLKGSPLRHPSRVLCLLFCVLVSLIHLPHAKHYILASIRKGNKL